MSYGMMLQGNIDYETDESRMGHNPYSKKLVNKIINDFDRVLEDTLKFEYASALRCYVDVLSRILQERGQTRAFCKDLSMYLEVGASDSRIFVLLSAGLSRNTAVEIYDEIPQTVKDVTTCIEWLREHKSTIRRKLHEYLFQEIDDILGLEDQQ